MMFNSDTVEKQAATAQDIEAQILEDKRLLDALLASVTNEESEEAADRMGIRAKAMLDEQNHITYDASLDEINSMFNAIAQGNDFDFDKAEVQVYAGIATRMHEEKLENYMHYVQHKRETLNGVLISRTSAAMQDSNEQVNQEYCQVARHLKAMLDEQQHTTDNSTIEELDSMFETIIQGGDFVFSDDDKKAYVMIATQLPIPKLTTYIQYLDYQQDMCASIMSDRQHFPENYLSYPTKK